MLNANGDEPGIPVLFHAPDCRHDRPFISALGDSWKRICKVQNVRSIVSRKLVNSMMYIFFLQ